MRSQPAEFVRDIGPLSARASVSAGSWDEESYSFEMTWTTGARVLRGFFDRFWEELSLDPKHVRMARLQSGSAPFLDAHSAGDMTAQLGVITEARLESGSGRARVRLAKGDDAAERLANKIRQGIARNVSVGYAVHRFEKVSGGDEEIPVYRAVDWEPFEVSAVPMGADPGAVIRGAVTSPCVFVDARSASMRENESQGEPTMAVPVAPVAPAAPDQAAVNVDEVRAVARREERERQAEIRRRCAAVGLSVEFANRLADEGVSVSIAKDRILDELAGRQTDTLPPARGATDVTLPGSSVTIVQDSRDKYLRGGEEWILVRAGLGSLMQAAAAKRGAAPGVLDPGEFRGLSFVDMARESLERVGVRTRGMDKHRMVGMALTHRGNGYHTASDFGTLLENVMHKVLMAAYDVTPDTWSMFCAVGSVTDFRAHPRYRLGMLRRLDEINEHGEFKNQPIQDAEKESITAKTRGNIIAITRQALISDDLSAFSRLATQLGRAARLTIELEVYDLLKQNSGTGPTMADGKVLFHADHNNISTGAALSADAIDKDRIKLAKQKDPNNQEFLDLRPAVLVVPIDLGSTAREINSAEFDPDKVAASASNRFMVPNRVRGLFRNVVDTPHLSGTRRYLFADPAMHPAIEVAFLEGQQAPFLESQEGWRVDGIEWKARLDFGVAALDFRTCLTNAGA